IPYIFVADLPPKDDHDDEARWEIVDGTQRIRTLDRFLNNDLKLCGLEKLKKLNEFKFKDLPLARQRRFNRATLRMIVLTDKADEETRRDL
ncbi:MAG: GmrSD restriction endonuclease domain-containing protein, partial [Nostoc sp.]